MLSLDRGGVTANVMIGLVECSSCNSWIREVVMAEKPPL